MRGHIISGVFASVLISLALAAATSAALVTTTANTGNGGAQSAYDGDIVANDLVNTGQPALSSTTSTLATFPGYTLNGLHDGLAISSGPNWAFWNDGASTVVTFTLDTTTNVQGYNIQSIASIVGFDSSGQVYANQNYDVSYSTVAAPATFLPLASVTYTPITALSGASKVILTDTTGLLATSVKALQFTIDPTSGSDPGTGVYREIDVVGAAVPEPTAGLALAATAMAMLRRRARY